MMSKRNILLAMLMLTTVYGSSDAIYTLDGVHVYADKQMDRFGNPVTEQSYYRTGGDVNVISQKELEHNNYAQMTDALKRIPGVAVRTAGYRGGEYGYKETHSTVSINGDDRVIVLIDGRRVDNSVSGMMGSSGASGSKSLVDIDQVVNMSGVESIEVIKGPGASIYGADASGGVINIITKKGSGNTSGMFDVSMGSWGKKHYQLSLSGSDGEGIRYFLSGGVEKGGNSHYHDGITGKNYEWIGTDYNEKNLSFRMDADRGNNKAITFSFGHMDSNNGYPLTAPDWRYMDAENWNRIQEGYKNHQYGDYKNKGYRNSWYKWVWTGSYTAYNKNNADLTYTFQQDHGMASFVRLYWQQGNYYGSFGNGGSAPSPIPNTPEWYKWAAERYDNRLKKSWNVKDRSKGVQLQYAKAIGIHNLIALAGFDQSYHFNWSQKENRWVETNRNTFTTSLQDKIDVSEKFQVTPAIRFLNSSDIRKEGEGQSYWLGKGEEAKSSNSSATALTGSLAGQYLFTDDFSMYGSCTQVHQPLKARDYIQVNGEENNKSPAELKDDEGVIWAIGVRKNWNKKTDFSINYSFIDMKNAVARYSIQTPGTDQFTNRFVNAKQQKKSINLSFAHRLNEHWKVALSYTYMKDKWEAKNGEEFNPELDFVNGNVNTMINKFRPANLYTADIGYEGNKFYADLFVNYYTGNNTEAFTAKQFLVMDMNMNYEFSDDIKAYMKLTNLTNEAWQTTYTSYLGIGAWPQPGRAIMMGVKYKF